MFWMPQDMPERMSERMSEDMPDRMPEKMSEDMSDRMSEDMPERMSEDMPERMLCSYICHGGDHSKWSNWCFLMLGPCGFSWSSKITAIFTRLALRLLRSLQAWHFQPIPASAHLPTSLIRWNYVMSAYECRHITKLQKHRGNLTSDRNSVRQLTKTDIGSPWISCFMHCAFLMVCYSKCRIQI